MPQTSGSRAPEFVEGEDTTRRLAENAEADVPVGEPVTAVDGDSPRVTYALGGQDAGSFALDPRIGQLRTRSGIDYDYETQQSYTVSVRAEDGHGGSASIVVVVDLINEPEPPSAPDPPRFVASTRSSLTVGWSAPANTGPEIRDYDGQFRSSGSGDFELGWDRVGLVTEATIGQLEEDTAYEVRIRARNAEGESDWSENAGMRTEANQPPVFDEGGSIDREVEENATAGTHVGSPIAARDPESDQLAYSLLGADAGTFAIDSPAGQLKTAVGATIDYESRTAYAVTVRAEDEYGGEDTIDVAVSVVNVPDTDPVADAGWDLAVVAGGTAWLDGTGSTSDAGALSYSWSFVSWPGAGAPALVDETTATPSFVTADEGTYVVRLSISQDGKTDSDDVSIVARPSTQADDLTKADLLVDSNRDGAVNSSDETGEDEWDSESGAVFGPNVDDDDFDGVRDAWDDRVNGARDLRDMAPVVVRRIVGLHRKHTVTVAMTLTSTSLGPRLFRERADGEFEALLGHGVYEADLPLDQLVGADVWLYLESRFGRDSGFDGRVELSLTVEDDGTTLSEDSVVLRGGPIVFSHHLDKAERVLVVDDSADLYNSNRPLLNALYRHLPSTVGLWEIDADDYYGDRWIQDSMQAGQRQLPSTRGPDGEVVFAELQRGRGLEPFLADEYLGPGAGYADSPGGLTSTFNYGGNVEVIPPYTNGDDEFPLGRIVIGGNADGTSSMSSRQRAFFQAQGVQVPLIVVDTSWLTVGHVDEIFSVVPHPNAEEDERSWVIAIGSTTLAIDLLQKAVDAGLGAAPVFGGRGWDETTPNGLLNNSTLMARNATAQQRIDTVRAKLKEEVGLEDSDFVEVPALFRRSSQWLTALVPSIQNLLVVDDVLLIPDPEGPVVDGNDVFRQATRDALGGLGVTIHFVDVWNGYHVLRGAIHCGTNVERKPPSTAWWLAEGDEE